MSVPYRPLGLIKNLVESMGLTITHSYEDLVFIEHNAFLLQMGQQGEDVLLHFNKDSVAEMRDEITASLIRIGQGLDLAVHRLGLFEIAQEEGSENIRLEFLVERH